MHYYHSAKDRRMTIPNEAAEAASSKFADWERCDKRHGSQAAHLLDCDGAAALRDRQPSRGGLIGNGPAMVRVWTSGDLVSFAGPNGPWQAVIYTRG